MEERISMLRDYDTGVFTDSELAMRYGVSRESFYVWKKRRGSGDPNWFRERSRAPRHCPQATTQPKIDAIIALRHRFPQWGPKKLRARLMATEPDTGWPAASTIGDILKRQGLIEPRARRRKRHALGDIITDASQPNDEWAIDFKGWFRTRDGARCDPLTVSDTLSRYLLDARIVPPTYEGVYAALERLFGEVGLPIAIRSDNGAPFGARGAAGLSRLSGWFLKLGIEPRHIPPSSPQDNGRHERMHRTLKAETTRPPAWSSDEQQQRFDRFCAYYNEERPHEALAQTPPSAFWQPSKRAMPGRIEEPWYDADWEVRRVRKNGQIKWRRRDIFIGEAFKGETVGLNEIESGGHMVRFCTRDLGVITADLCFHSFAPPRARLRFAVETKGE